MINVSQQNAQQRLKTIPAILKDVFFSVEVADTISRMRDANHLSQEKASLLAELVGAVLLGFLHREDLAKEIHESLLVNPEVAKTLAEEINRKILDQYKEELDHVFAPSASQNPSTSSGNKISGPVVLKVGGGAPTPLEANARSAPSRPLTGQAPQIPGSQIKSGMTSPSTSSGNTSPAPFIIERTTTAAPAPQKPGFRLDIPKPANIAKKEERPVAARLEIGGEMSAPPRVIHYSAMKTPIPTPPRINIGERSEKKEESSLPQPNLKPTVPPAMPKGPVPFDVAQGKSFAVTSLPIKPPQTQIPGSPIPPSYKTTDGRSEYGMTSKTPPPPVVKFSPSAPKASQNVGRSTFDVGGKAVMPKSAPTPPPIRGSTPSTSSGYKSSPQAPRMTPVPLEAEARHDASRPLMRPSEELPPPHQNT